MDLKLTKALEEFDKEVYFNTLVAVAGADNEITEDEKSFIEDQATLFGFKKLNFDDVCEISELDFGDCSILTRSIVIRDCITLAYVDGEYCDEEREKVVAIARIIGLEASKVSEIESWLQEYWSVMDKFEAVFTN